MNQQEAVQQDAGPTGKPVYCTDHAADRWSERTTSKSPGRLRDAWNEALGVDAPDVDADEVRLYPPEHMLLLRKDRVIVTVLEADYRRLDATGYTKCPECERLDDPIDGDCCSWCGASRRTSGGLVVLRRGG